MLPGTKNKEGKRQEISSSYIQQCVLRPMDSQYIALSFLFLCVISLGTQRAEICQKRYNLLKFSFYEIIYCIRSRLFSDSSILHLFQNFKSTVHYQVRKCALKSFLVSSSIGCWRGIGSLFLRHYKSDTPQNHAVSVKVKKKYLTFILLLRKPTTNCFPRLHTYF